jgi:formylglycine-generating enzyme required for sulfatase activity
MTKPLALTLLVVGACWTLTPVAPAAEPATQPAKKLTLDLGNNVTLKLVLIPAGKFLMGSPASVKDRFKGEDQHEVTISKSYYMGVTHVTVDQYAGFVKDTGQKHDEPSFKQTGDHPAVNVSWHDAQAFCQWLSKKTNKAVTLPTEAQWEYACRAKSKTRFSFGDKNNNMGDYSWFVENSGKMTHPVAQKKPNAWGLYDMHGNAWQWCADYFGPYVVEDKVDPTGPKEGNIRSARGGSWIAEPPACRSAFRCSGFPQKREGAFGFRVAVAVDTE